MLNNCFEVFNNSSIVVALLCYLITHSGILCWMLCLVGWLLNVVVNYWVISRTGPKTERLTIYVLPHMRQSWETMASVSAGHIILTPTQPLGSGRLRGNRTRDLLPRSRALYRLLLDAAARSSR